MDEYLGEISALITSLCWSIGPIFFTLSGRYIGASNVNRLRLVLAVMLLSLTHFILFNEFFPLSADITRWFWLGLSGIIGFAIGDNFLFTSFVMIGPQVTMLLMSLVPIFSALFAWIALGEVLTPLQILSVLIIVAGIIIVVVNKNNSNKGDNKKTKNFYKGIMFGFIAALAQATGLILAKKGLEDDFSGLSATLIRASIAAFSIWIYTIFRHQVTDTVKKLSNLQALSTMFGGVVFGPFLGVWFSMIAISTVHIGIASSLMSLPPVILLPISYLFLKEKVTLLSSIGTIIALAGTILIFLVKN